MKTTYLTQEQKKEAKRFFNLRRRILDSANIKDKYNYKTYDAPWICLELDIEGLSDQNIFALVVIAYYLHDYGTPAKAFEPFGWSKYKVYKLAKNEKYIYSQTLLTEDGLLAGKGYVLSSIVSEMNRLYEDYLWHDITEEFPENRKFMFDVDIPDIYTGKVSGFILDGVVRLKRPSLPYNKIPNWPVDGYILKDTIEVSKGHIKRWKIISL